MQERFKKAFTPIIIVLVAGFAFGLGRLSKIEENKLPLVIEQSEESGEVLGTSVTTQNPNTKAQPSTNPQTTMGKYVASKSGEKYHYPWCSGAKRITEANKIWFNTVEEAQAAGYTPAANCPGL